MVQSQTGKDRQMTKETFEVEFEVTDTFGGDRNYSWVKRETFTIPCGTSDRAMTRRLKAFAGWTGWRGRSNHHGGEGEFHPYRTCMVAGWRVIY
jgi:hypothetical protein